MNEILTIEGLEKIYKNYDAFILDQWGVMHDGVSGYKNAINCIEKLFNNKKKLIIISNSSKRKISTKARLPILGYQEDYFSEIMTSGEMIWNCLYEKKHDEIKNLGKNCFHIFDDSNEDGKKYINGLDNYNFVDSIEEADFILACTPHLNKKVIDFVPLLDLAKQRELLFICANPDFDTIENNPDSDKYCMGTIAQLYRNIGGKTFELGKPSSEIYDESIKKINNIDKSRILAIGDSIHHDILGASNFGIDSLLITSTGIHKNLFDVENPKWQNELNYFQNMLIKPTFISSELRF